MRRKGLMICTVLVTIAALSITGCSKKEKTGTVSETTKQEDESEKKGTNSEEKKEKVEVASDDNQEVTIMLRGDNTPDADNLVLKELEKRTNTKINMIYTPGGDYETKLSAMIAAGNIPDIFLSGITDADDYKNNGLLLEVGDLIKSDAPNIEKDTKDIINKISVNKDGIYMIPNCDKKWAENINLRTDWLKNLNLEMPTDLESFRKVMNAFTYDDPNQNGKKDTYGYAFSLQDLVKGNSFANIFGAFGIPKGKSIELEDGTVTSWVKHPQFVEAMAYIKSLIDDGVCEPDYITIPNMDLFGKLWTGVAGCIEWECVGPTNNWMPARYTETPVPTFDFPVIKGPDGKFGVPKIYTTLTAGYVFGKDCKNLKGAMRIANYCMSPEGSDLLFLGIEDVMYRWLDKDKGEFEYLDQYKDSATHRAAGGFCYWGLFKPSSNAQFRTLNKQTREGVEKAWSMGIEWPYITEKSEVLLDCGADMEQVISEMIAEMLSTDKDLKTVYDEYIEEWENVGGSDWEKEATELWKNENK